MFLTWRIMVIFLMAIKIYLKIIIQIDFRRVGSKLLIGFWRIMWLGPIMNSFMVPRSGRKVERSELNLTACV
ncbi:MAG: hypothetical protein CFE48_05420 [Pseudomonas sp. PGPPP2]|nr:MAG: hypothetical protein CFE48_05420 [Pseudomonas sp. PGPPP2]